MAPVGEYMSEPDFTPKDILDKMAIDRSDYRFVAERNELRREWMKRQQREIFKINRFRLNLCLSVIRCCC